MRIGVLTHSSGDDNYGQLLQCYALQQYLKKIGHSPFLIQYHENHSSSLNIKDAIKAFVRHILRYLSPWHRRVYAELDTFKKQRCINSVRNIKREFIHFKRENIELSTTYTNPYQIQINPPKADAYIVGSDQVWNPSVNCDSASVWYLQFGDKKTKRISYAASFGRLLEENEYSLFRTFLSDFNAISVREDTAIESCCMAGVLDVRIVLDPTLLINKEIYMPFVEEQSKGKPYLFLYYLNVMDKEDFAWNQIEPLLNKRRLELKSVSSSGYYPAFDLIPGHENLLLTIPEWINAIYHSEYVVTTSFHGVVFAIIMHRPFVAIPLKGEYSRGNSRITTLLHSLGLDNHLLTDDKNIEEILLSDVNWDKVDSLLTELRKDSEEFLSEALKS